MRYSRFYAISVAVLAQQGKKIDDNALKNAGKNKEEWISYNRDWSETRFSPLDQINATNVSKLGLAWSFDIPNVGAGTRQEATHLISNGVLYSITPWSVVYAVDARTGKILWQSDPEANRSASACCGVVNRGIALYEGKVIAPVIDGRMRALDMQTGKLVWETRVTPTNLPYTITMAPRVIKGGRVIVGASGGEYAVRGLFAAFDADTGKELWKFYTVPGDPSKPFEQPIYAEWAKTWDASKKWWVAGGGGPVWGSIAYDPDEDLVYVGTGQPGPWSSVARGPGDNLCTDCIIAVKGATGKVRLALPDDSGRRLGLRLDRRHHTGRSDDQWQEAQSADARAEEWILLCDRPRQRTIHFGRTLGHRELGTRHSIRKRERQS